MICDTCGCSNIRHQEIEGYGVAECQVCGALHGDPDVVSRIEEIREGDALQFDREIYPLVRTINMITGFKVIGARHDGPGDLPYVHFKIHGPKARVWLEKLMTSLTMANRELPGRWMVEVLLIEGLTFSLTPVPGSVQRAEALVGLELLTRAIRRNMNLSWWHELDAR